MESARRGFLRGQGRPLPQPMRPPWATTESLFVTRCTRCGDCLSACPTGLLVKGDGGLPMVDFSLAHCTYCGACAESCATQAIDRHPGRAPWTLRAQIGESCLTQSDVVCRSCGDICEVAAIVFRPRLGGVARPELSLENCNGCGECLAPCPVAAISIAPQSLACVEDA